MCREYSSIPASVYDQAWQAAYRHKWIESERQGRDLGHAAIKDWSRLHFKRFYRWCHWLHLTGQQWFQEFPASQFNSVMDPRDEIERQVIHCFWDGQENLEIFLSAHGCGWPIERVRVVLSSLGINEARLSPLVK